MRVRLKLFATFREGREKEQYLELDRATTVRMIIERENIDIDDIAICIVNGRDADYDRVLEDGDTLALFPPVGGG